ncbi:hypothetical protein, partial [Snodgrassella communis]|uniref:hypothetical protein n=1 Tax=Snodgrassella communis TaxID=2946699 RepID=UPI0015D53EE4
NAAAGSNTDTAAFIVAVVFDVAAGEAVGGKLVFTRGFGGLGGGDDGAFEVSYVPLDIKLSSSAAN